ncbi:MAG: DMT family transporter [Pseudomonadota bacterium]
MSPEAARGIRFALLAMTCFAFQDGISKHLASHYPAPFFVMIRYWFFAAFVLVLATRWPGGLKAALKTRRPVLQCARGVLLAVQILVFVAALDRLGLAVQMSVFSLYPLLITLLAVPVLGERVGWRRLSAVGVGFLGVLVILRPGLSSIGWEALIGLASALGIALYALMTRIATQADGSSHPAFVYTGLAGAVAITLVGPFYWTAMTPPDWGWMALLCLAGMSGHYCLICAYDATEAMRIQPFAYLQMVFGIAIGWTVFAEPVDPWAVLGVGLIIAAGLYALWREARGGTS